MGGKKPRKTLLQLQDEVGVSDPAAHAKRQVGELDKTAQRSLAKRKFITDQLASDAKELKYIQHEMDELNKTYIPLCEQLDKKIEKRKNFLKQLDTCLKQQKGIFDTIKGTVGQRKLDDSKLSRKMATLKLQVERGYSLGMDSTFRQSNNFSLTKTGRSSSGGAMGMSSKLASSAATLPELGKTAPGNTMKRNESAPKNL